jgi:tetratricopeptide (TPR) repeat protein
VRAVEHFQAALAARRNFSRAKNELARILIQFEDFDAALPLAANTYDNAPHNTFFIRTYFEALVRVPRTHEREQMLKRLLEQLKRFTVRHADEMFLNAQAQYAAFYERNFNNAITLLDQASRIADNPAYHLFTKFQIYRAAHRRRDMRRILADLRQRGITEDSHWGTRLLRMEAIMHAMEGNADKALGIANSKLSTRQPSGIQSKFLEELHRILAQATARGQQDGGGNSGRRRGRGGAGRRGGAHGFTRRRGPGSSTVRGGGGGGNGGSKPGGVGGSGGAGGPRGSGGVNDLEGSAGVNDPEGSGGYGGDGERRRPKQT